VCSPSRSLTQGSEERLITFRFGLETAEIRSLPPGFCRDGAVPLWHRRLSQSPAACFTLFSMTFAHRRSEIWKVALGWIPAGWTSRPPGHCYRGHGGKRRGSTQRRGSVREAASAPTSWVRQLTNADFLITEPFLRRYCLHRAMSVGRQQQ
jgi:hypothetical protein